MAMQEHLDASGPAAGRRTPPTARRTPSAVRRIPSAVRGLVARVAAVAVLATSVTATAAAAPAGPGDRAAPAKPLNLLVVGTDGRDTITPRQKKAYRLGGEACNCTDTIMLVHVAANRRWVSAVSLPRDTLAQLPDGHVDQRTGEQHPAHPGKINSGFAEGGTPLAVQVIEQSTGVPVDGVLDVDFSRFMKAVDAAKGVPVCTDRPMHDPATGINLSPGTHRLAGGPALQYVRSRKVDNRADFGRIQRQQRFVTALLGELMKPKDWTSVGRLAKVAAALSPADSGTGRMSTRELLDLAVSLRHLKLRDLTFATLPIQGFHPLIDGVGSTLAVDEAQAAAVFRTFTDDVPLERARTSEPVRNQSPGPRPVTFAPVKASQLAC
ncbi:LCP family protein [Streptomyces sp. NPDC050418]|uniref:LCP family protein n=1 Tax=Streptomyces sp. NPDC050418 TaxID=3365612 RepID=UPI003789B013